MTPAEHLVLIASEQLWPNLHAVELWRPGLRGVWVYATADEKLSAGPARALAKFCHPLPVTVAAGDADPAAVARQLHRWIDADPSARWVVNATGGTKLMFDGAASVRGRPGVRVVYRELRNHWFELGRAAAGTPTADPIAVPAAATDRIPVEELVRTLWETDALTVTFGPPPDALDVPAAAAGLVATGGNWHATFTALGATVGPDEGAGLLFERYVAAGLLAMGVWNLARGVKQLGRNPDGTTTTPTQEIDLVANQGSRLLVFDCKLRTAEEDKARGDGITSQLRQAALTARRLGGLAAEVVLLRPNRTLEAAERALADDLRVRVIDHTAHGSFFARLAAFVGVPLPPPLAQADAGFAVPVTAARVFHTSAAMGRASSAADGGPVIDRVKLCGDWARECGRDWAVLEAWPGCYAVQTSNRAGRPRAVWKAEALTWLGVFGAVEEVRVSRSGDTLSARLTVAPADEPRWTAALRGRMSRSLFDPPGS